MGRLVQVCEDFAEGRQADEAWRRLIGDSVAGRQSIVFAECPIAIQNGNLSELSDAFELLCTPEAARQAEVQHQNLFQFDTGIHRLSTIRQAIACACLALVTRQPLLNDAGERIAVWSKRATGVREFAFESVVNLTMLETTDSLIRRVLESAEIESREQQSFAIAATRWFAGMLGETAYELTIPILLFDPTAGEGSVARLHLKRLDGGTGRLLAAPHSKLQIEIHSATSDGFNRAWESCKGERDRDSVDVVWELIGANSISGRSAEAAFQVGLRLLLKGLPYDGQCVISASVDDNGMLQHVGGINDPGHPKLSAATALMQGHSGVTVITSPANRLSAPEESEWKSKGVTQRVCTNVDEALQVVSRQLALLQEMLQSQIDSICAEATNRFGRPVQNLDEFNRYVIPVLVAQGIRTDSDLSEQSEDSEGSDEDGDGEDERRVISWSQFSSQWAGNAILLGDPGFGKTTLLWHEVAAGCMRNLRQLQSGLPITEVTLCFFLPASQLPAVVAETPALRSFVDALSIYARLSPEMTAFAEHQIASGKCQLFIDALDEVSDPRNSERFFARFTEECPETRILLSSRLTGFTVAPIKVPEENHVELQAFTVEQMKAVVGTWFDDPNLVDQVWTSVSDERLVDVLRSPILLNLARQQVSACISAGRHIPNWRRRTELYDDFLRLALRQHRSRTDQLFSEMEEEEFPKFLQDLAFTLWKSDAKQSIFNRSELVTTIKNVIKESDLWSLRERYALLLKDLQDCGVLVPATINDQDPQFMFLHRTIGEYLAGKCLARRLESTDQNYWALIEKKCWAPEWKQVMLFCAGSLSNASELLERLQNNGPTSLNPYGDDLLRHRLLLAAQSLPEVAFCENKIEYHIVDQVMRSFRFEMRLSNEAVSAIRALVLVRATFRDEPILTQLRPEAAFRCFIPAGYSDEVFELLTGKLWDACATDERRAIGIKRNPFPFAKAIVSLCPAIAVDRLCPSNSNSSAQYWRVIGTVFREAAKVEGVKFEFTPEFVRRLGSNWLDASEAKPSIGLSQAVEYLPSIPNETLRSSSVITECCILLADDKVSEALQDRALMLLAALGEAAAREPDVPRLLAKLAFNASGRTAQRTVASLRCGLATPLFIQELSRRIREVDSQRQRTGIEMLLALQAVDVPEWKRAFGELAHLQHFRQTFVRMFAFNPAPGIALFIKELLATGHRSLAVQAIEALVKPMLNEDRSMRSTQTLDCLDLIIPGLVENSNSVSLDSPVILERLLKTQDLSLQIMTASILKLAFKYRATRELVDWALDRLFSELDSKQTRELMAECLCQLTGRLFAYLQERMRSSGKTLRLHSWPRLAARVLGDTRQVLSILSTSHFTEQQRLESLAYLPEHSLSDHHEIDFILHHLSDSSSAKRRAAARAVLAIEPLAVDPAVAKQLIQDVATRTNKELWLPVRRMIEMNPQAFVEELDVAFRDEKLPGHDDIMDLLPALGERIKDTRILPQLMASRSTSGRRTSVATEKVLLRLLPGCAPALREELFLQISEVNFGTTYSRVFGDIDIKLEFVLWLIQKLNSDDQQQVYYASKMLMDRDRMGADRKTVIEMFAAQIGEKFCLSAAAPRFGLAPSIAHVTADKFRFFWGTDTFVNALSVNSLTQ